MHPQLGQVGSLTIYSYGVLIGLGTLLAIVWPVRLAAKQGIPAEKVEGLGLVIVLSAVVGSKLLTALDYPGFYSGDWSFLWREILNRGGVFYGGLLFALATSALYFWLNHLPGWKIADCVTPGLALAQGIARMGCFLAGCCWGIPTHLPFGVTFTSEQAHSLTGVPLGVKLHPTQLYEAALVLLAIPFLLRLLKHKSFDGEVVLAYIMYYAVVRFFIEFLRGDPRGYYFNDLLSTSQLISLLLIPIAALLLVRLRKQAAIESRRDRTNPRVPVHRKVRARAF
jgi:phosphatidylglycerol:prolipoprotein diacylglycerol transferase